MNAQVYGNSGITSGSITINNKIDYKKYKSLNIIYTASLDIYNGACVIDIYNLTCPANFIKRICYSSAINTKTKISIDITQIDDLDSIYFYLQAQSTKTTSLNLYEVWLEK
jgi:hypothetical protein